MRRSDFIFYCVHLLYQKCHGISQNCGGSYIDSLVSIKKARINPISKTLITAFNILQLLH